MCNYQPRVNYSKLPKAAAPSISYRGESRGLKPQQTKILQYTKMKPPDKCTVDSSPSPAKPAHQGNGYVTVFASLTYCQQPAPIAAKPSPLAKVDSLRDPNVPRFPPPSNYSPELRCITGRGRAQATNPLQEAANHEQNVFLALI
uniref:uncharacterized protein LOC120951646 n=1 Tax=Anopheles coluzzii TaxID=1518534 RepID=UPI0020FF96C4|nr:uncharacterized protein LOC120951646 [Anopheles coluzzii]